MQLLNRNSYEKGGWILYMLRKELGDEIFWKGIKKYYATYRDKNASTKDLEQIFELISGKDLHHFIKQWLFTAENPQLEITWSYLEKDKKMLLSITQATENTFLLPLEIKIIGLNENSILKKITITKKITNISFPLKNNPTGIEVDPNCNLLFEAKVTKRPE
jgi:aminopeptidase N